MLPSLMTWVQLPGLKLRKDRTDSQKLSSAHHAQGYAGGVRGVRCTHSTTPACTQCMAWAGQWGTAKVAHTPPTRHSIGD